MEAPEQIGQFLAHVEGDRWAPLWRLIATTGMRRGERSGCGGRTSTSGAG